MITIAFSLHHYSIRGSERAIYQYAYYCNKIFGYRSIIIISENYQYKEDYKGKKIHDENIKLLFDNSFDKTIIYKNKNHLYEELKANNVNIIYSLEAGNIKNEMLLFEDIPLIIHCIFYCNRELKLGATIYGAISEEVVSDKNYYVPIVPHIVEIDSKEESNLRKELNIPNNSIVFGNYGGEKSFDLSFVHKIIEEYHNSNVYFLFMNTNNFLKEKKNNVIFLPSNTNIDYKVKFINTCDAFLHGRNQGESFGLAIGEFSLKNKPIITFKRGCKYHPIEVDLEHTTHHSILKEKGIYYSNPAELLDIFANWNKYYDKNKDYNCYKEFNPMSVMTSFNQFFIIPLTFMLNNRSIISLYETENLNFYQFISNLIIKDNYSFNKNIFSLLKLIIKKLNIKNYYSYECGFGIYEILLADNFKELKVYVKEQKMSPLLINNILINKIKNIQLFDKRESKIDMISFNYKCNKEDLNNTIPFIFINLDPIAYNDRYDNVSYYYEKIKSTHILFEVDKYHYLAVSKNKKYEFKAALSRYVKRSSIVPTNIFQVKYQLYLKPKNINNQKIYLTYNYSDPKELIKIWKRMIPSTSNLVLTNNKSQEYSIIVNKPHINDLKEKKYTPNKTIVLRMEPNTSTAKHWNDWYDKKEDFMYFLDLEKFRNNVEWHLDITYDQLLYHQPIKTKTLSAIVSSLYEMSGHKLRIDFLKELEQHTPIDIYGKDNKFNFKQYKGTLPPHNKNDGLFPYKYHFAAENCDIYTTEKFYDGILSECYIFYYGWKKLNTFIDERTYTYLDLNDIKGSINKVIEVIRNNEWEKTIDIIRREKIKILKYLSFEPHIQSLISLSNLECVVINLNRRPDRWQNFLKQANKENFAKFTRFQAIDGKELTAKPGLSGAQTSNIDDLQKNLFPNWLRKTIPPKIGEIGCLLSHYKLWEHIVQTNLERLFIMEDDAKLVDNFIDHLSDLESYLKVENIDYDILFIGYHYNNDFIKENNIQINEINDKPIVTLEEMRNKKLNKEKEILNLHKESDLFSYHGGGTQGYIITQKGAQKMINIIKSLGFVWPVDYHMLFCGSIKIQEQFRVKIYSCTKRLVLADMFEINNKVDSDVQE